MNGNFLKVMTAVMTAALLLGITVCYAQQENTRRVSGEIGWIDLQSGKLELNKDTAKGTKTTEYRINQNETRVTDPKDEKFLNVADLRAGQYITIEEVLGQQDNVIPKIIVEPMPESEYQQAFGVLKEIDVSSGTLTLEEKVRIGQEEVNRLSYFVFDQNTIVVMRSPGKQPVDVVLKPGDVLKVDFDQLDGRQQAQYITLYSPVTTTTTTTTITTTE